MAVSTDKPSKSALKRQHAERQSLGESLIDFELAVLEKLPLDEPLFDAIVAAKSMKSRGALRRQRQLIGKRMAGADVDALRAAMHALGEEERVQKRVFAQAERLRDRLIQEGEDSIEKYPELAGSSDALRSILGAYREALSDRDETRHRRELFRCIHRALTAQHGRLSR